MVTQRYDIRALDRDEVLRYLGYAGQPLSAELDARLDQMVARCLAVTRPSGVWRIFDIAELGEKDDVPVLRLAGCTLELLGHSIARHLTGAVAVGVLAVTTGLTLDAELRRLSLTDRVGEVLLDAAGSALVERAADEAEANVGHAAAARGLVAGPRFSPGYGDLPLATQPTLLSTLDAQRQLGITLSSSLLMTPVKSVTAVVGLFGPDAVPPALSPCDACTRRDGCALRAAGRTCRGGTAVASAELLA